MAKIRFTAAPILILVLLTGTSPAPIHSLSVSNYRTFFSLSHSLLLRVSNLRAERGDISGANRAKAISQKLQRGAHLWLACWGLAFSLGWDYVKNYAWRELDYRELYDAVSDLNELSSILSESMNSDIDRVAWVGRNYGKILATSKRLSARLLNVFRRSGPLREVVEAVQREVVDGDLLRDCLEVGSNDLKGLIQIIKDFVLQFYPTLQDQDDRSDL
ncbi:Adenine phosphoribosyltransferase [Citrus sinensis]|uniref:Adenine phosphoribosyltransferase n=1 Tax=Citrus sinensis TaxID=2711 RepID=A0ACB8NHB2_CITSI|nr:Adenine phosphoribosyltransferase [Citrus sinensis]